MGIQLVALDMDGTVLLDDHLTVTPAVRRSIEQALAKGVTVVPATGRVAAMLPKVFYELDGIRYVINSNGASVWDRVENRVIYSNPIPAETVRQILQILEPYGLLTQIYCRGTSMRKSVPSSGWLTFPLRRNLLRIFGRRRSNWTASRRCWRSIRRVWKS